MVMMNQETRDFIRAHADDDVRQLALRAPRGGKVDVAFALQQIAGRQVARRKLPSWAAVEGLIYPPHLSLEQCSSEVTARYKAALAQHLLSGEEAARLVDLTGGLGVDFSFMARGFRHAVYVEQQDHLCKASRGNFQLLRLPQAEVVCGDATDYLRQMQPVSLIYIDPARRDTHGQRTFGIADCVPNVLNIADELARKCRFLLLKLSPMLDWHEAVAQLCGRGVQIMGAASVAQHLKVTEVHIVSVDNECKELLVCCTATNEQPGTTVNSVSPRLVAINILNDGTEQRFEVDDDALFRSSSSVFPSSILPSSSSLFLYEPNASIMKVGCFGALSQRYGVEAVGRNSHLFLSRGVIANFPGRCFRVVGVTTMNKRELKEAFNGIEKANVTVRNFPLTVQELRKRLRLADGGDVYVFATTVGEKRHMLFICRKIS